MEMYAESFDNAGALDKLEGFASFHGPDYYSLPRNTGTITPLLQKRGVLSVNTGPIASRSGAASSV